jgi:hypothetical protein
VAELIGKISKNSQKIVESLGRQECELKRILEHKNLGRDFLDSKGIPENASMLCYAMQPNALLIWQNFIMA